MRDILELEIGVLLLRHGTDKILRAIARAEGQSEDELRHRLEQLRIGKRGRTAGSRNEPVDPNSLLRAAVDPDAAAIAFAAYEDSRLLPRMRDVKAFLQAHGQSGNPKSRKAARVPMARALVRLSADDLQSLSSQLATAAGRSEYEALASQIMRGPRSGKRAADAPEP